MPRGAGLSKLVLLQADALDRVVLDEDERVGDATTLLELLNPPIADPCLAALRRSLSLTYICDVDISGEQTVREIRQAAIPPLGVLGEALVMLNLQRVDADETFQRDDSAKVFTHVFLPRNELRRRVRIEGERRKVPLADIFEHLPADRVVRALRKVLSMTFEEATTPRQFDRMLEDIRFVCAEALFPCNSILEAMELEPVAIPTRRRFIDGQDTYSIEDDEPEDDVG